MLWLLSCVAIAAAAHTQNLKPVGAEDVARVEAVERWLLNGTAPPAWWDVRAPADVRKGSELSRGASKRVCSGRLASSGAKVVVKTIVDSGGKLAPDGTVRPRPNGKITPEHRRAHLLGELFYLEALRGRPGVPELRGAYTEEHRGAVAIAAVVDDGGRELTRPDWKTFCRSEPRRAARSLLSCLRSVVDLGGYFQTDFSSRQLTLRGGAVYMVDAPDPLRGPMYAWGEPRGLAAPLRRALRGIDAATACAATCDGDEWRLPSTCGKRCAEPCLDERRRCALALRLPHVKDVATSWWALPLVVSEGRKGPDKDGAAAVDAIREAMAAPAPEDRLSFGDALARLEEGSPT
jgi:hypothetical protein